MARPSLEKVASPEDTHFIKPRSKLTLSFDRHPGVRWAQRIFVALASLYLAYLVVMNALLMTGAFPAIMHKAQKEVRFDYALAWTVIPFTLQVDDLRLTVVDQPVQMAFEADHARMRFHVTKFLDRTVHMEGVRADNLSFYLRRCIEPGEISEKRFRGIPPIPDRSAPICIIEPQPDYDLSNNWDVRMDDIDMDLSEVWVDHFRFEGTSRLRGGFYIRTERSLEVWPSELLIDDGLLELAAAPFARRLRGEVTPTIREIDLRGQARAEVFDRMDAGAQLQAEVTLAGLQHFVPPKLEGGDGTLDIDVDLRRGVIRDGSEVVLDATALTVRSEKREAELTASELQIRAHSDGHRVDGELGFEGAVEVMSAPAITISHAQLIAEATAADLGTPPSEPSGSFELQGGKSALDLGDSKGPAVHRGSASLSLEGKLERDGTLHAAFGARLPELTGSWGEVGFVGSTEAHLFARGRRADGRTALDAITGSLTIEADSFGAADDREPWKAEVSFEEVAGSRRDGRIGVIVTMSTLGPLLDLPPTEDAVPGIAEALVDLEDLRALFRASWQPHRKALTLLALETDGAEAEGRWIWPEDGDMRGAMVVEVGPGSWGIAMRGSQSAVEWFPDDEWRAKFYEPLTR